MLLRLIAFLDSLAIRLHLRTLSAFPGSKDYWEHRYVTGGNSGFGSYGKLALFKANIINKFVAEYAVKTVIEFGCGDGNQLKLANYPQYLGFDVSETAVSLCKKQFFADPQKEFRLLKDYNGEVAELALSLDVIYHLVEDSAYENHMATLFNSSCKYVIIYSTNSDSFHGYERAHVKHRKFTNWISAMASTWKMLEYHEGPYANFYIYKRG